jgi:hypothetical protein
MGMKGSADLKGIQIELPVAKGQLRQHLSHNVGALRAARTCLLSARTTTRQATHRPDLVAQPRSTPWTALAAAIAARSSQATAARRLQEGDHACRGALDLRRRAAGVLLPVLHPHQCLDLQWHIVWSKR